MMRSLTLSFALAATPVFATSEVQVSCDFSEVCVEDECFDIPSASISLVIIWANETTTFAPMIGDSRLLKAHLVVEERDGALVLMFDQFGDASPISSANGSLHESSDPLDDTLVVGFGGAFGEWSRRIITIRLMPESVSEMSFVNPSANDPTSGAIAVGSCTRLRSS